MKCNDPPTVLISNAIKDIDESTAAKLPNVSAMRRAIQRARKNVNPVLMNGPSRQGLVIDDSYKLTIKGELFLMYDRGNVDDRFLIFSTAENLQFLSQCEQWLCDGTFRSVPSIFCQLYTIHGLKNNKSLPLVYILAPDKSEKTYLEVLKQLKILNKNLKPKWLMMDFELAFINAFRAKFSKTAISGCLFHFGQCLWRRIQSCGLQRKYNTDPQFSLNIKKLMALAFVPEDDVIFAYDALINSDYFDDHEHELSPLLEYFEETWIGRESRSRRRRRAPHFDISMWNCYNSILEDRIRTNNNMEGWHKGLNARVGGNHVQIGAFINSLKAEQNITEMTITQINTGVDVVVAQRREYRARNRRLKNIANEYNKNNVLEYLKNIALVLAFC